MSLIKLLLTRIESFDRIIRRSGDSRWLVVKDMAVNPAEDSLYICLLLSLSSYTQGLFFGRKHFLKMEVKNFNA